MLRHFYRLMVVALGLFVLTGCAGVHATNKDPIATGSDHDVTDADDADEDVADNVDTDGNDIDNPYDPDIVKPDADLDADSGSCDNPNVGKNCKTDTECGACLICVSAKCAAGCQSDDDCSVYAGTTCNTKLSRCVNATASAGACDETSCSSGCCYATKGFQSLKCLSTASLATCGICHQGEVYMDGKQCVPAACKTTDTKCQTYNATAPNAQCFECDAETFLCQNDPTCADAEVCVGCEFDVQGIVMNAQGDTLAGIEVVAYAGTSFETSVKTGPTGIFNFKLQANYGCDIGEPETIPLSFHDIDGAANGGSFESTQMDAALPWTASGVNPCKYQKNDFVITLDKVGNDDNDDDTLLPDE